jgi:hypothetical protein
VVAALDTFNNPANVLAVQVRVALVVLVVKPILGGAGNAGGYSPVEGYAGGNCSF